MSNKTKNFFNNQWVLAIGSGIVLLLFPTIFDFIKSYPFLTSISKVCSLFFSFFFLEIKVYWIFLVWGLLIIISTIRKRRLQKTTPVLNLGPEYLNYTSDVLKKLKWSWEWYDNKPLNEFNVINMVAHCPNCDTIMKDVPDFWGSSFTCPRCNNIVGGQSYESKTDMEFIILDNLRKQNFKVSIKS